MRSGDGNAVQKVYIRVELALSEERRHPIFEGHRPPWNIGLGYTILGGRSVPILTDAVVHLVDNESLAPGATGMADLEPLHPEHWTSLEPGTTVDMMDGPRRAGTATVLGFRAAD